MEQHFGRWLEQFRDRLDVKQEILAHALRNKTYNSISQMEDKAERRLSGPALESLVYITGCKNRDAFDEMWMNGEFPDVRESRRRVEERAAEWEEDHIEYLQNYVPPLRVLLPLMPPQARAAIIEDAKAHGAGTVVAAALVMFSEVSKQQRHDLITDVRQIIAKRRRRVR